MIQKNRVKHISWYLRRKINLRGNRESVEDRAASTFSRTKRDINMGREPHMGLRDYVERSYRRSALGGIRDSLLVNVPYMSVKDRVGGGNSRW